ncbi:hypothetical protein BJ944DRAFT_102370 [Cunninghamella echinulata]|nr:hypothetical protein BJ944DRAFT_102370 [Cunninghamella echinulata]
MPSVDEHIQPRTFIALPPDSTQHLFIPIITKAESEVAAHTSLFNPTKNNEYYNMGSDTISLISEMMARYNRKYNTTTTTTTSKPSQPIDLDLD